MYHVTCDMWHVACRMCEILAELASLRAGGRKTIGQPGMCGDWGVGTDV